MRRLAPFALTSLLAVGCPVEEYVLDGGEVGDDDDGRHGRDEGEEGDDDGEEEEESETK